MMATVIIGLAASTLTWLQHLKKKDCTCAQDANYKFIMFMCYYVMAMGVIGLALSISKIGGKILPRPLLRVKQVLGVFNLGLIIALIVVGFKYVKILKDKQCQCALDDPRRKLFQAWIWLYIALYVTLFITLMVALLFLLLLAR